MEQLCPIHQRRTVPEPAQQVTVSHMTIMLVENDGSDMMTLGDLVFKYKMLENKITTLPVGVSAQGSIVFGTHTFTSKKVLVALVCLSWSSLL